MIPDVHERPDPADASAGTGASGADADGVVLRLWTRRPVSGARARVVDRLSALRADRVINDFDVRTWPDEVALSHHTDHDDVVEAYGTFREWADDHDVSITPPFERRTTTSVVGRTEEFLVLPSLCLAVHDDGLRGVFPCRDGDRTCTISDVLDAYEGVDAEPPVPVAAALPEIDA